MAIKLVFSKSDDTPWGFRLTGGADCEIPLTVIKVAEGGISEAAGLQVDDVVIKINERDAEDLSHIEAHDVFMDAGQHFTMTVIRNDMPHDDEQHNEEVSNILNQFSENEHKQDDHFQQPVINPEGVKSKAALQEKVLRVHFEDADLDDSDPRETQLQNGPVQEVQQKKWSTFLQKPSRPAPVPKKDDIDKPVVEPYRVIIKKQPKKTINKVQDEHVEDKPCDIEVQDNVVESFENEPPVDENTLEEQNIEQEHVEDDEDQLEIEEVQEDNEIMEETSDNEEVEFEQPVSLEEELARIQQQLQCLAQVPTSIQDTLEALTEKLAKIVGVSQVQQNSAQEIASHEEHDNEDEDHSYDDDRLPSITEEIVEAAYSSDEYKLDMTDTTDISEDEADNNNEAAFADLNVTSLEQELRLKQAEEAEREQQELEHERCIKQDRAEEFHQRRLEQRPTVPLAPVQRPIILPGGRKWCEPDDALPKPRKSKMSDEKICETLDNYSEIISGHTKGINFLKYQPAPKNLDYLQRSEVFRMIHDTDPPKSGIAARSGLIVSEEDYYRNNSGQHTSVKV